MRPGAISRPFQRLCSTAHAISQTIVANVVRPDTPPAGAYSVGAAKMPASLSSTTTPIANAPMPPPRSAAIALPLTSRELVAIVISDHLVQGVHLVDEHPHQRH